MPRPPALLLLLPFCACNATPTLAEPQIQIAPYYAMYKLSGMAGMDTVSSGTVTHNPRRSLEEFGFGDHEDDVGVRGEIGNGFAGLRVDWYRMDSGTSRRAPLPDPWGALQTGDLAGMHAVLDELRIGYAEEVLRQKFDFRELKDLEFRLAPGVVFAHRDLSLNVDEDTFTRRQDLDASDKGVVYGALRARLQYQNVFADVEYAISPPGFDFGGDFRGLLQDFEARLSYQFELRDIEVFAGWRRSTFGVNGNQDEQNFTGDFVLSGFMVGVRIGF